MPIQWPGRDIGLIDTCLVLNFVILSNLRRHSEWINQL